MHRLRIIFGSETLNIAFSDLNLIAFEAHPQDQIVKPFNHCVINSI